NVSDRLCKVILKKNAGVLILSNRGNVSDSKAADEIICECVVLILSNRGNVSDSGYLEPLSAAAFQSLFAGPAPFSGFGKKFHI
ncbi:hypothetical protein, partial [Desulfobacter sp.]|uniref:hypothetical protein n=1 Tax=Desulfobacter sp. TaxID=2294 RepID=UPI003D13916B